MATPAPTSFPAEGQSPSPARVAVDVIAVTPHDDFLVELGQVLGGQASITPVASTAEALEELGKSKRIQILMIDSRGCGDLRTEVDTLRARASHAQIVVFAEAHAEESVAANLNGSEVFAVLSMPVDQHETAAAFGGAVAASKARQTPPQFASSLPAEPIRPAPREDSGENKINSRRVAGIALAVVAAAAAVWLLTRNEKAATPAAAGRAEPAAAQPAEAAPPTVETSLVKGKVDDLLEKARTAMRERRYTDPAGDNALLYYRSAAYADATNGEALDGLTRVAAVLATRLEEALDGKRQDEAALTLEQLKSASPQHARLAEFQSRLSKLRAEIQREEQEEARQKRLAEEKAAREATAAEQKKAREAKAAAEAERKAQLAREQELERMRAEQAAKTAQPATKSTPEASSARAGASLQASLKRKRYVAPEYPEAALAKGLGGVVIVVFTVDVNGETRDVHVESAEPPGLFEKAAVAAVKRWRYEPLLADGVPTEVPTRMTIRFAPPQ